MASVIALVGLSVALGETTANADATYTLSGEVADTTATGIAGIPLELLDSTNTILSTTATAADGTYSFPGLDDGTYTVESTGPTGYVSIQATAVVADADTVLNITDARIGSIAGTLTANASPLSGAHVKVFDTATNAEFDASAATDANGNFSVTLPANTAGYTLYFTNSGGTRLPIVGHDFGTGAVVDNDVCMLGASASALGGLASGTPVKLAVVSDTNLVPCGGASPTPTPSPSAKAGQSGTSLAQTGTVTPVTATPTPTASPTTTADTSTASDTNSGNDGLKPLFTPTASTAPMPVWGWVLVVLAMLALFVGVGFTVVRHR